MTREAPPAATAGRRPADRQAADPQPADRQDADPQPAGRPAAQHRSRRSFLAACLAAAVSPPWRSTLTPASGPAGWTATALPRAAGASEPWFRISLAEWSLHRALFSGRLDHLEFITAARRDYGIDAVEYVNVFFFERAGDPGYLQQMRRRCDAAGVRSLLIMCDREGDLGDPDPRRRAQAVDNHLKWLDAAAFLGCHSIRVNAASEGSREEQSRLAADGLHRLAELAAGRHLYVLVENHGGLSSDAAWLVETIRRADHPNLGTLPDFGNFRIDRHRQYDRYKGVAELMPYARAVSAKSHDFDAQGNETTKDYLRLLRIVRDAGYRGHVGIEYEGDRLPEPEGIHATKRLLERVREQLAPGAGAAA